MNNQPTPETKSFYVTAFDVEEWAEKCIRLENERDEAREEAHRFRSLHYSRLGINGSASWFPWEAK